MIYENNNFSRKSEKLQDISTIKNYVSNGIGYRNSLYRSSCVIYPAVDWYSPLCLITCSAFRLVRSLTEILSKHLVRKWSSLYLYITWQYALLCYRAPWSNLARPVIIHSLMCMTSTPHCGFSGVSPDGNCAYVH